MIITDIEKFVNEYCFKSDNRLISKRNLFKLYKELNFEPIKFNDFKKYCDSKFETYTGACYAKKDYRRRNSPNVYKVYFKKDYLIFDSKIRKHDDYIEKKHKNKYQNVEGFIFGFVKNLDHLGLKLCSPNGENLGTFYLTAFNQNESDLNSDLLSSKYLGLKVKIQYYTKQGKTEKFNNIETCDLTVPKAKEKACYYVTSRQAEYFNENIIKFNDHISTKKIKENKILNSLMNG